nr:unnamed protein product [Digitaria exilis]
MRDRVWWASGRQPGKRKARLERLRPHSLLAKDIGHSSGLSHVAKGPMSCAGWQPIEAAPSPLRRLERASPHALASFSFLVSLPSTSDCYTCS